MDILGSISDNNVDLESITELDAELGSLPVEITEKIDMEDFEALKCMKRLRQLGYDFGIEVFEEKKRNHIQGKLKLLLPENKAAINMEKAVHLLKAKLLPHLSDPSDDELMHAFMKSEDLKGVINILGIKIMSWRDDDEGKIALKKLQDELQYSKRYLWAIKRIYNTFFAIYRLSPRVRNEILRNAYNGRRRHKVEFLTGRVETDLNYTICTGIVEYPTFDDGRIRATDEFTRRRLYFYPDTFLFLNSVAVADTLIKNGINLVDRITSEALQPDVIESRLRSAGWM